MEGEEEEGEEIEGEEVEGEEEEEGTVHYREPNIYGIKGEGSNDMCG